jgi:hypothetical protein
VPASRRTALLCLPALAAALALLSGCQGLDAAAAGGPSAGASGAAVPSGTAGTQLTGLKVAADGPMTGYSREQFGDGWAHEPDGCDARVDVLEAQGQGVTHKGCTVTGGHWLSLYDGVQVTSPHDLDIDHIVPLAEAWRTGAASWTADQRKSFANDTKLELVAVSAHSNRSKGDSAPPGYEPPAKTEDCSYAERWIAVKSAYHLTITSPEHDALAQMLTTCSS